MRKILPFYVLLAAALLAASRTSAAANIFTGSDAYPLDQWNKAAIALEKDILQSARAVNQPTEFAQQQVACLNEVQTSLDQISGHLGAVSDLVHLSAVMSDPSDERKVNSVLARGTRYILNLIAIARRDALNQAAVCSTSALVNTYAQKAAGIADYATTAINAIDERLVPDWARDH